MFSLDFVEQIDNINYERDQIDLINKAKQISENKLKQLIYITTCLVCEKFKPEFHLQITIPAGKKAKIYLPIIYEKDEYGFYVDWGDSIFPEHNKLIHEYKVLDKEKTYDIKFFGFNIIGFGERYETLIFRDDKLDGLENFQEFLTAVISFGELGHKFVSLENAFYKCKNNFTVPTSLPSSITNINKMFSQCFRFNQSLELWNTVNVTSMASVFNNCYEFDQPLSWNVSNVVIMCNMFYCCYKFNQPLNLWNVSNVKNMACMFKWCKSFNQPLDNWQVQNVENMSHMFFNCYKFTQQLNKWLIKNTTNTRDMFFGIYKN